MVNRLTNYFKQKHCFFHMIFGPTSIVLAARFEVVRGPQFKLIIWLVLNWYEKYNTRKVLFRYAFCLFFETLTSKGMKISLILNNIATWFKVGGFVPHCVIAPSICTLADLLLLEESTFFIRFDPLPFSAGLPRIPFDIWKTAEDKGGRWFGPKKIRPSAKPAEDSDPRRFGRHTRRFSQSMKKIRPKFF